MDISLAYVVICLTLLVVICSAGLVFTILIYINLRSEKKVKLQVPTPRNPETSANPSGIVFCRSCGKQYSSAETICPICHAKR